MATVFRYRAIDAAGSRRRGTEAAESATALIDALESRGLIVVGTAAQDAPAASQADRIRRGGKRDVLEATRALASLLAAGVPLSRALSVAAGLTGGTVAAALDDIRSRVERGEALSSALAEHHRLFPALYTGLVRAGERSGALGDVFTRLAAQLEREDRLRARLISLSIYPMILAVAGGIAVVILLLVVLPRFVDLLAGSGAPLPRSTALLVSIGSVLRSSWLIIGTASAIMIFALAWWLRTEAGGRAVAGLMLQAPVVGPMRRQALGARFSRVLGVLLSGGAPLLEALTSASDCTGDPIARDAIGQIRERVVQGATLNHGIGKSRCFPALLGQLVAIGEASGQMAPFLVRAADMLEERAERAAERLAALAEPAMIVMFGGVVGFIALALLQAIYSVNAGSFR
jgi:type II secretory pathway component PulF